MVDKVVACVCFTQGVRKMRFLFWNTNCAMNEEQRKKVELIDEVLGNIICENAVDVVILAEYGGNVEFLCRKLLERDIDFREVKLPGCDEIIMLAKSHLEINLLPQSSSYSLVNISFRDCNLIVAALHLPSKLHDKKDRTKESICRRIIDDIQTSENNLLHDNTIIVGDFNVNPFEDLMLGADLFCANPFREETIKRKQRTFAKDKHKMFYNPMWTLFNENNFPIGTYYYTAHEHTNTYWHMLDQVLVRPCLVDRIEDGSPQIIYKTQSRSLLNRNGYPANKISDHLPLFFEIREEEI